MTWLITGAAPRDSSARPSAGPEERRVDFADDLLATIDTALEAPSLEAIIAALLLGKARALLREQRRQLPEPIFTIPGEEIIAILHRRYQPRRSTRR